MYQTFGLWIYLIDKVYMNEIIMLVILLDIKNNDILVWVDKKENDNKYFEFVDEGESLLARLAPLIEGFVDNEASGKRVCRNRIHSS